MVYALPLVIILVLLLLVNVLCLFYVLRIFDIADKMLAWYFKKCDYDEEKEKWLH